LLSFNAKIDIIGVNPFVLLPAPVLNSIFKQAKKDKGPIPVRGAIDGHKYIQTLVKYSGEWRLYINILMLKVSQKKVGDAVNLQIEFDPIERIIPMHPKLKAALINNQEAKKIFDGLSPSKQKEIVRYISFLKTEISVDRNVLIAIQFLLGKSRFVGRDKP
jgi:low affinity Fe/Cu permease